MLIEGLLEIQPELDAELLRQWAGSAEVGLRMSLAGRPDLPADLLPLLCRDPDYHVRGAVAGQQLPPEWIEALLHDPDEQVRAALAQHQINLTPDQLHQLAQDANPDVRRGVASRPNLPTSLAEQLLQDESFWVRYGLSINDTIPDHIRAHFLPGLVRGAEDASSGMAANWVGQDIARELGADAVAELLARGDDLPVITEVALLRNPNVPAALRKEWLADLVATEQDHVLEILSGNPALDAEDTATLLAYKNGACYTEIRPTHPLSTEQLQTLIDQHWQESRTLESLIQHPAFAGLPPETLLVHPDFGVFFTVLWQQGKLTAERPDLQGKAIYSTWRPRPT